MTFDVKWEERDGGMVVVQPSGQLDSNTYTLLEEALNPLLKPSLRVLVFDMRDLQYITSAGLRVLFKAAKTVEELGGTYLMSNLQPQIQKVFDIIKVLPSMQIFRDIEEVDAYLDAMQQKEVARQEDPSGS
ncbi:MAG: STAS domain-containing protein [Desulfobacteraceae bacterium]|jgi:anti-anti-sigma factor